MLDSCKQIKEFKTEMQRYEKRNSYPETAVYLEDLDHELDLYLQATLSLTEEDIATIKDLSDAQLLVLVNERLNHEE